MLLILSKHFPRKESYWKLSVTKISKLDFINPINIPRPDSTSGFGFFLQVFSQAAPSPCERDGYYLATFWVNFMQLSKELRPWESLDSFKDFRLRFPIFLCTLRKS